MFAYIKEIQSLLLVLIVFIALFIFRAEVRKMVNWIVSFKRVSKTKDGYEASSDPGPQDRSATEETKSTIQIEIADTDKKDNGNTKDEDWRFAFILKDYPKAYSLLKENIEKEQDKKEQDVLQAQLGFVKFKMDKEDGVKYFELAISEGKANSDWFYWYAFSYNINNNHDGTIKVVKKGIELNCASPSLYRLYTDSLFEMGKGVDGIEILQGEIHRNPEEVQYYIMAAEILTKMDMKSLAKECYLIVLAKNPNDESVLKKHADIAVETESYKEAMHSYRRQSRS